MNDSRRDFLKKSCSLVAVLAAAGLSIPKASGKSTRLEEQERNVEWPVLEGESTPKLCMSPPGNDEAAFRKMKQIGVSGVMSYSSPRMPWQKEDLKALKERYESNDLQLINLYIRGFNDVIHGRENSEAQ